MTDDRRVSGLLFDLDGTLVDTETHTEEAIDVVMAWHGISGFSLPPTETRGRTWAHVAEVIRTRTQLKLPKTELSAELLAQWNLATAEAKAIPGAPAALRAAAARKLKLAV